MKPCHPDAIKSPISDELYERQLRKYYDYFKHFGGAIRQEIVEKVTAKLEIEAISPPKNRVKKTSDLKGVSWNKRSQKWLASATIDGRTKHIGLFENENDAHRAYLAVRKQDAERKQHKNVSNKLLNKWLNKV